MEIKKKILNDWSSLKEKGDVSKLAEMLNKNESTVSRILSGKQETTLNEIEKIVAFFDLKKIRKSKIKI